MPFSWQPDYYWVLSGNKMPRHFFLPIGTDSNCHRSAPKGSGPSLIFLLSIFLGHTEVVKFLIEGCKVNPFAKDR
jgi:hypothetical protein